VAGVPDAEPPQSAAAATTSRSVFSGSLWYSASSVLPQIYVVIVSVVAARYLGPEGMGQQSFISFAQLSAVMLLTGGLPVALMRFFGETLGADRPGAIRSLLRWAWGLEAVGAVAGAAILIAVGFYRVELRSAWMVAGIACALTVLHTVPSAALIGLQRWRQVSTIGITTGALSVVATVAVLVAGYGITGMFVVEALMSLANLVWATVLAQRAVREMAPVATPADDIKRKILPYAGWVTIDVLLSYVVSRRSEFFFLEAYSTNQEIAFYSIAFGAMTALLKLANMAGGVAAPAVATLLGAGDLVRIARGYGRAMRLTLHLTLPLTAVALALGPLLVGLAYGSDYTRAGDVLTVLLLGVPITAAAGLAGGVLSGLGQVKRPLAWTAVATVINVVAAFLLVPRFGATGAALANTTAQAAAGLPVIVLARRQLAGVSFDPASLLRTLLAAGLAGLAAGPASSGGGWGGLVLGAAAAAGAFAFALVVLRPLSGEDGRWLADTLGRGRDGAVSRAVLRSSRQESTS